MKRQGYVKNPKTGRLIKINGSVYKNLKKSGVRVNNLKKVFRQIKEYPINPDVKISQNKIKRISKKKKNVKSPDCGWSVTAPKKGKERQILMKKCGKDCFLSPKNLGFPICPKCSKGQCNCKVDCRGLFAAMIRGKQWKYHNISKSAYKIGKSSKCSWATKK